MTKKITAEFSDVRLDRWFSKNFPAVTHGQLEKLLRTGQVRVNGGRIKSNYRLQTDDEVRLPPALEGQQVATDHQRASRQQRLLPEQTEQVRSWIIYQDPDVIVLNKPSGLAVQGGSGIKLHLDNMLSALRFDEPVLPKLVHRLDKDTSGILVLARNDPSARYLTKLFRDNLIHKTYWAVVKGVPVPETGMIDLPLAKDPQAEVMRVDRKLGKPAVTEYRLLDHAANHVALLALHPVTGRTHQLRVHCMAIGHSILGDDKYQGQDFGFSADIDKTLHLHARKIEWKNHKGKKIVVLAPLSPHMQRTLEHFGLQGVS